jgi:catechol 2,3-dioxygenase-like lactoylglutathione lyase family enzyme
MSLLPTLALRVTDLGNSIAFYRDRVGFTLVETNLDHDVATFLDSDGDPMLLAGPGADDLTPFMAETHYVLKPNEVIGFHGGDLVERQVDLRMRGVENMQLAESQFGDATLSLKDPDGYILSFISSPQRSPEEQLAVYARMPDELDAALAGLSEFDLELTKEASSWSIRQIVHHVTDGDLLFLTGMRAALMAPGQLYKPTIFGGNDVVSENLDYAHRPIAPGLALSRAVHDYVLELAQLPGAWERFSLRDGGRQVSFGDLVTFAIRHSVEHIEEIREIRMVHGL